ncbi:MAG: helix-hairpin-helix domain-containing protein [archaeon]|nr:helix-hairpin-helix domain-containing protein [archaeon]
MRWELFLVLLIIIMPSIYAECNSTQVDINSASWEELDKLDGIGPAKADAIIQARPFDSVEDLLRVIGIGDVTLNKIKDQGLACVQNQGSENKFSDSSKTNSFGDSGTPINENSIDEENDSSEDVNPAADETNKDNSNEILNEKDNNIKTNNINYIQENLTAIDLTKSIKIEENKSEKGTGIYSYGLVFFCCLLAVLILIRRKQRKKWEEMA